MVRGKYSTDLAHLSVGLTVFEMKDSSERTTHHHKYGITLTQRKAVSKLQNESLF